MAFFHPERQPCLDQTEESKGGKKKAHTIENPKDGVKERGGKLGRTDEGHRGRR